MPRPRSVHSLSIADAAYIAGLVDGEGTIALTRRHLGDSRQPVVSIANTELRLLEFVLHSVGAGKITHKRTVSAAHTPSFCYSIANRQALELLAQIQCYLRTYKRKRAALLLSDYVKLTPRNGKYSSEARLLRQAFEETFLAIRAEDESGISTPGLSTNP